MTLIWENKKASLDAAAEDFDRNSPALVLLQREDLGEEWRSQWLLLTRTFMQRLDGTVCLASPIELGIRYHISYLSHAPHPCEIVTVIQPRRVFHPNATLSGVFCLGHPEAGASLEYILNQAWAGLTFNMKKTNTRRGDILNPEAARYVRARADRLPLTEKGILEEPDFNLPATRIEHAWR